MIGTLFHTILNANPTDRLEDAEMLLRGRSAADIEGIAHSLNRHVLSYNPDTVDATRVILLACVRVLAGYLKTGR